MNIPKVYQPNLYEADIYALWEASGAFAPSKKGTPFCIIMPPPNANGSLHWGHAVGYTLTDIITRYKRMRGYKTLWLPGTDHAGIETQFVYERDVLGPRGQSRLDFSPEQFYADVMAFTLEQQQKILSQFRSMGFSPDWNRLKFTLDPDIINVVYETFRRLHQDGHVYRGNRIVNWCPRCQAAFADIELDHRLQEDAMYMLDYGPLQVATARPETIFADVAVAVNPADKRYQGLIGQQAVIPLVERPVPIIADDYVDIKTGTGALKITPGHDPNDYLIGQRHALPEITVIDRDGRLVNVPEPYAGLSVTDGRTQVVADLKRARRLAATTPLRHRVAIHDRCGTVIEPLISEQWFLRVSALNRPVIEAVEHDKVKIFPRRFKKVALEWLKQEHDWCISRDSCWWGIRMPVYYRASHDQNKEPYLITAEPQAADDYYGAGHWRQESATFDTWFSSGQWPFATLMTSGPGDFKDFYPTSLMGTAREILHKWVTRMMMFSLYRTGKIPFEHVYLWGLVTDEHGKKMSKSKGNVVDPLKMTAIYGTDALRLAGAITNTAGTDSPMSEKRVEAMRNFCNKLWNTARFVESKLGDNFKYLDRPKPLSSADHWLLGRLSSTGRQIGQRLDSYRLNEAAEAIYHLLWDDFADWYIEASKVELNPKLLAYGLETILKLAHPFVPFVTEAIWQTLKWENDSLLINRAWPEVGGGRAEAAADFEQLRRLVKEIRLLKSLAGVQGGVILYHRHEQLLEGNARLIEALAGLDDVRAARDGYGLRLTDTGLAAWLDMDQPTIERLGQRLRQQVNDQTRLVGQLEQRLANPSYVKKAPSAVVGDTRRQLEQARAQLERARTRAKKLPTG